MKKKQPKRGIGEKKINAKIKKTNSNRQDRAQKHDLYIPRTEHKFVFNSRGLSTKILFTSGGQSTNFRLKSGGHSRKIFITSSSGKFFWRIRCKKNEWQRILFFLKRNLFGRIRRNLKRIRCHSRKFEINFVAKLIFENYNEIFFFFFTTKSFFYKEFSRKEFVVKKKSEKEQKEFAVKKKPSLRTKLSKHHQIFFIFTTKSFF